jgi:hypothetical protein
MNAGAQIAAAIPSGRYGNHIDACERDRGAAVSAAGLTQVTSAATPMISNPAAQPKSMRLALL